MKSITLSVGSGTRLYLLTTIMGRQLYPVYDEPMVYYPLSALMLAGVHDLLVISTSVDLPNYEYSFGGGLDFGIGLSFVEHSSPDGLAQASVNGCEFMAGESCSLVFGDNIFYGNGPSRHLRRPAKEVAEVRHAKDGQ